MTRRVVYGVGLWVTAAATAMTLASIMLPRWIRWESDLTGDVTYSYGLHKKCSTVTGSCEPFPSESDCLGEGQFCTIWRTVGFFMNFAVILEFATFISFVVVLLGGVQQRSYGWKLVCTMLSLVAVIQAVGMSLVAYVYDHDERFFPGWKLDLSWVLCTISWSCLGLTAVGIGAAKYALPDEGGYELIRDDYD